MGNLFFLFLVTPSPRVGCTGSAEYELDQITDQAENGCLQLGKKHQHADCCPVSTLAIASSEGRRWQLKARDEGCCETSPLHSSAVLADVELMVQLLLPFPLLQSFEELAEKKKKSIHVVLRAWASLTSSC